MDGSYFTNPFDFGFSVGAVGAGAAVPSHYSAASAAAEDNDSSHAALLLCDEQSLRVWLTQTYGVDEIHIDDDYVTLLRDLPSMNERSEKFVRHLTTRGSANHYIMGATVVNHAASVKKSNPRRKSNITMSTIAGTVCSAGGRVFDSPVRYGTADSEKRIIVRCRHDHYCMLWPEDIDEWCLLCKCQSSLIEAGDSGIVTLTNTFGSEMRAFRFMCSSGHEFMTTCEDAEDGCPSCKIEAHIAATAHRAIKVLSPFEHKRAPLRMHCEMCRLQFYCSENGMKDPATLSCDSLHAVVMTPERTITQIRHFLELIFREKFDDIISDEKVYFDALSIRFGIALIYEGNGVTQKQIAVAMNWCKIAGVTFIKLPKKNAKLGEYDDVSLMAAIIRGLITGGMMTRTTDEVVRDFAKYLVTIYERLRRQHRPLFCTWR